MSKYIPNSRIKNKPSSFKTEWSSDKIDFSFVGREDAYINPHIAEKERIEAIPLEQLSFRDLYKFPFHQAKYGSWVYDAKGNFIFQFEFKNGKTREQCIEILNGDWTNHKRQEVKSDGGMIYIDDNPFILIRGWGNLTGCGAYNLDGEYAGKIQDTLEEYIIEKLSK